jgi:hypothetical protein
MNIQKIFDALRTDNQNSALGIICGELEEQGYSVVINHTPVTSDGLYDGDFHEFEQSMDSLNITLLKKGEVEQKFGLKFVDFHDVIIQRSGS